MAFSRAKPVRNTDPQILKLYKWQLSDMSSPGNLPQLPQHSWKWNDVPSPKTNCTKTSTFGNESRLPKLQCRRQWQ